MKYDNKSGFLKFFVPVIEALKEIGGTGRASEVTDLVIDRLKIPRNEREWNYKTGYSRIRNQIAWARFYLAKAKIIDSGKKGTWTLTAKGWNTDLCDNDVYNLYQEHSNEHQARVLTDDNSFKL